MFQKLFMCPPTYFSVSYVINPWMITHVNLADQSLAQQQWQSLYQALKPFAEIELITPVASLPDMVFTANAGLIKDNKVILSNFRHEERVGEQSFFKAWFAEQGYELLTLPASIFFEGEGDALFHSNQEFIWMGYGIRTDLAAANYIEKFYKLPVIPLQLVSDSFYHLDTCFCPLIDGTLMYFPEAFTAESQREINHYVPANKQIIISETDANHFACNALCTPQKENTPATIFVNALSDTLRLKLNQLGYQVIVQPVTEFMKAGGAIKCLTLILTPPLLTTEKNTLSDSMEKNIFTSQ